jgi:hypothetical protein
MAKINFPLNDDAPHVMQKFNVADEAFAKYNPKQRQLLVEDEEDVPMDVIPDDVLPRRPVRQQAYDDLPNFAPAYQNTVEVKFDRTIERNQNPLAKYFRKPGTFVNLPTKGQFYNDRTIKMTNMGQVAVQPMAAADELLLQNPDALFNGEAIKGLMKSCIPDLYDVDALLTPDVDTLLLAIRVATYGNEMELDISCPNCEAENQFAINIKEVLGEITFLDSEYTFTSLNGLTFHLKPYSYKTTITASLAAYEEMKFLQAFKDAPEDVQKLKSKEAMGRVSNLAIDLLPDAIIKVTTPDGDEISDHDFIKEFIQNSDKVTTKSIQDIVQQLNNTGINRKVQVDCVNCDHHWETEISFDPSHFFG